MGTVGIDIVAIFEAEYISDFKKDIKNSISNPAHRCEYLDLLGEFIALKQYLFCAVRCEHNARGCAHLERVKFYKDLGVID